MKKKTKMSLPTHYDISVYMYGNNLPIGPLVDMLRLTNTSAV
jgi:hypothetical protein